MHCFHLFSFLISGRSTLFFLEMCRHESNDENYQFFFLLGMKRNDGANQICCFQVLTMSQA